MLFIKNWIGFMYWYDQRVTFKLPVLVSLVLVQKQNYLSVEIQLLMEFQSKTRLKMHSIPNDEMICHPEPLQLNQ